MKLFLASLALLASSIASVSAYYNIPCPNDGTCCMFKHMDADGEIKLKFTDHSPEILDYQALAATTLGCFSMGPVTEENVPCSIDPTMNPCESDPCSAYSFEGLEFDECDWDQHKDGDGILLSVSHECEFGLPKVPHCMTKKRIDGNELIVESETIYKKVDAPIIRQRKLRGDARASRLLSRPWFDEEELPIACPLRCPVSVEIDSVTYETHPDPALSICDDEGCECTLCSVLEDGTKQCNIDPPESVVKEEKPEKPEKTDKPEPVVCVNIYGIFSEGPKSAFPDVQQRCVRNGPCTTQIVCKKDPSEVVCNKPALPAGPVIKECVCATTAPEP